MLRGKDIMMLQWQNGHKTNPYAFIKSTFVVKKKQTIFNSAIRYQLIDISTVNTVNEYFWPKTTKTFLNDQRK